MKRVRDLRWCYFVIEEGSVGLSPDYLIQIVANKMVLAQQKSIS